MPALIPRPLFSSTRLKRMHGSCGHVCERAGQIDGADGAQIERKRSRRAVGQRQTQRLHLADVQLLLVVLYIAIRGQQQVGNGNLWMRGRLGDGLGVQTKTLATNVNCLPKRPSSRVHKRLIKILRMQSIGVDVHNVSTAIAAQN